MHYNTCSSAEEMRNILNAVIAVQFANTSWGYQGAMKEQQRNCRK